MKHRNTPLYSGSYCAFSGIANTIKTEANMKFHLLAAAIAVAMGIFLQISSSEWLWIFLAIFLVMGAETMNTAIESLSNRVSPEYHPLIKSTKDAAAGAVLLMALFSLVCGLFIFLPKIIATFS